MKLTEKDKSILIGLLLGDGYIDDKGRIYIEHREKQKDYCIYKAKLLHSVCGGKDIKVHEYIRNRSILKDKKQFKESTFTTYSFKKQSQSFIPIRQILYDANRKKYISEEILQYLTPEAIALWWMDDGCLTKKYTYQNGEKKHCGYTLRLYTYLPKEQNEIVQKFFEDIYQIKWNVVKADGAKDDTQWMLRCGTIEGRKFLNIIREYIIKNVPSLSYKVINI